MDCASKWRDFSGIGMIWSGGAGGVRTRDLLDAIEARSQLRYGPSQTLRISYNTARWCVKTLRAGLAVNVCGKSVQFSFQRRNEWLDRRSPNPFWIAESNFCRPD